MFLANSEKLALLFDALLGSLDAPRGFEPRLTVSETGVLPLDDRATASEGRRLPAGAATVNRLCGPNAPVSAAVTEVADDLPSSDELASVFSGSAAAASLGGAWSRRYVNVTGLADAGPA